MIEVTTIAAGPDRIAASRSRLYQLLTIAFAFPEEEFFDALRDGSFAAALADACAGLPYDLTAAAALDVGDLGNAYVDFQSEYIRLFDVGAAGPPCPLYGGEYGGDRMKTMEDATRFYNFFDLHMAPQMRELPDHITTQLEFMHYLTFREAEVGAESSDRGSLQRAERDFLERHLGRWLPRMQAKLAKQQTAPFFVALVRFAVTFLENDRAFVAACAGTD